ncbi:hypothetical protein [Stenotrophomonas pavanii]|uniref:hypothetical protein n=1 Tax=Stenotrophomonas pavanii TaxID=487698 RepID=UPI0039C6F1BB
MKTDWVLTLGNRVAIAWAIAAVGAYLCDRFSGNAAATLYSLVTVSFAMIVLAQGFMEVFDAQSAEGVPWGIMFAGVIVVLSMLAMSVLWMDTYCKGSGEKSAWVCSQT